MGRQPESQNANLYGLSSAGRHRYIPRQISSHGYGGEVTAYNITIGDIVWKYVAIEQGFESPHTATTQSVWACACDGKPT